MKQFYNNRLHTEPAKSAGPVSRTLTLLMNAFGMKRNTTKKWRSVDPLRAKSRCEETETYRIDN